VKGTALGAERAVADGNIGWASGQGRRLVSVCDRFTGSIAISVVKAQSVFVTDEHHVQVGRVAAQGVEILPDGIRGITHLEHVDYLRHGSDVGGKSADSGVHLFSLPGNIIVHGNAEGKQQENCRDGKKAAGESRLQSGLFLLLTGIAVSLPSGIFHSVKI